MGVCHNCPPRPVFLLFNCSFFMYFYCIWEALVIRANLFLSCKHDIIYLLVNVVSFYFITFLSPSFWLAFFVHFSLLKIEPNLPYPHPNSLLPEPDIKSHFSTFHSSYFYILIYISYWSQIQQLFPSKTNKI